MNSVKRVIVVGPDPFAPRAGGVAAHMGNLMKCESLTPAELRYHYVDPTIPGWKEPPWALRRGLGSARIAASILRAPRVGTVVHLNTYLYRRTIFAELPIVAACVARGIPLFTQIHGGRWSGIVGDERAERAWRWTFDQSRLLGVFLGEQWRELASLGYEARMRPVRSLLQTTDVDVSDKEGPARFLFLGRLVAEKGILELLEAFGQLWEERPDVRLTVIGSGDLKEEVKRRIDAAPWKNAALYPGFVSREELERLVGRCNIFVLPSTHPEGFPLAFLESCEQGLAALVTTNSAIPELFEEGAEFLSLDVNQPGQLLAQMRRIAGDPGLRAELGHRAKRAVGRLCSIETAGAQYAACWEEAADRH